MNPVAVFTKYLPYLLWLGVFLTVAGLVSGTVSGTWGTLSLGLLLGGLVTLGGALLTWVQVTPGFWQRRSTQLGTNALLSTLAVLVIVGIINLLGSRYSLRVDLTENQRFTLAPQTQTLVSQLQKPVKVWVLMNSGDEAADPTRALLEQYQRLNPQFSFEIADPRAQPNLASRFELGSSWEGSVFLEVGDRRQLVQQVNRFSALSESKLTGSLEQITAGKKLHVYLLQGHGELPVDSSALGMAALVEVMNDKNFQVDPLQLVETPAIPEDADVVVIAGPQQPLLASEVKVLEAYLNQGGSLLVMIDPGIQSGLEVLLGQWGVQLDDRLVINASQEQILGPATVVIGRYGDHPITKEFGNRYSIYPNSRPLDLPTVEGLESLSLLVTGNQYWAESDPSAEKLTFNPEQGDRPGPLTIAAVVTGSRLTPTQIFPDSDPPKPSPSPKPAATKPAGTLQNRPETSPSPTPEETPEATPEAQTEPMPSVRLIVFGNSTFVTNQIFDQRFLNSDVFLNSIRWLSKQDDQVLSIQPKTNPNRSLILTKRQANIIGWTALALLPVIGFGSAVAIWWQRR